MPRINTKLILPNFCYLILAVFACNLHAQIVIGAPNLNFTQACANADFNTFSATFVFSPESSLSSANQFSVEISDANGDFSSANQIFISDPGTITTSPATVSFPLPNDAYGENYRIRIKSTAPAVTSSRSQPFPAYYKIQDSPFTINNLISTGVYCPGSSYVLTIDNPGSELNDSPLQYPSLTFNWYRETSSTTSVFVEQGETLEVSSPGTYFAETDYGTCTSDSFSNRVTITENSGGTTDISILSSLGNPFCPENGPTTLSTVNGISYQWFLDGEIILDATEQTYNTEESGSYSVQVDLGGCNGSSEINLVSEIFNSDINVDEINTLDVGQVLDVIITDNAIAPIYEWFFNGNLIPSETNSIFQASEVGSYSVIISETNGCNVSIEYTFSIEAEVEQFPDISNIPNIISPNNDGINDKWIIPSQYTSGSNTQIRIFSSNGKQIFETDDYQNNWPTTEISLSTVNTIFYYIISSTEGDEIKGIITLLN